MKKLILILCLITILTLCSCRKINQPDNNSYTSSNSSNVNSDHSSVTSDFVLPERNDPTSISSSTTTSQNDTVTSSYYDDTINGELIIPVPKLTIDVYNAPYYHDTVTVIPFALYNEDNSVFTYKTDFFLQRYENGTWNYYTTKNGEINYKYNTAQSTSYVEFITYNLEELYITPLPTGTYRFIQESDDGTIVSNSFEIVSDTFVDEPQ